MVCTSEIISLISRPHMTTNGFGHFQCDSTLGSLYIPPRSCNQTPCWIQRTPIMSQHHCHPPCLWLSNSSILDIIDLQSWIYSLSLLHHQGLWSSYIHVYEVVLLLYFFFTSFTLDLALAFSRSCVCSLHSHIYLYWIYPLVPFSYFCGHSFDINKII